MDWFSGFHMQVHTLHTRCTSWPPLLVPSFRETIESPSMCCTTASKFLPAQTDGAAIRWLLGIRRDHKKQYSFGMRLY
jgi:hypothetical protein